MGEIQHGGFCNKNGGNSTWGILLKIWGKLNMGDFAKKWGKLNMGDSRFRNGGF